MKKAPFDPQKKHTKLPLNYYYLTEFSLIVDGDIRSISVAKAAYNSRASVLAPFYKPISIDFPADK